MDYVLIALLPVVPVAHHGRSHGRLGAADREPCVRGAGLHSGGASVDGIRQSERVGRAKRRAIERNRQTSVEAIAAH